MNENIKELIAIGAAVAGHCQPCLTYHVGRAKELGVGEGEIREALEMGHKVERGAMAAMKNYAKEVMGESVSSAPVCCGSTSDVDSKCSE